MNYQNIIKYYWPYIRQYSWGHIGIFVSYGLAQALVAAGVPLIFKLIIDTMTVNGPDTTTILINLFLLFIVVMVCYQILFRIGDYLVTIIQSDILRQLSNLTLEKLQQHSYTFFSNNFGGSLIAKSRRFVNAFETIHDTIIFHFWFHFITLVSAFSVLFYESWILGVICLLWLLMYTVLIRVLMRIQEPKSLKNAALDSKTTGHLSDIITNILTIKMFGASSREQASFATTTRTQEAARRDAWLQQGVISPIYQSIAIGIFYIVILGTSLWLWQQAVITVGTILLIQVYMNRIFDVVWNVGKNFIKFTTALTDASEMVQIFETPVSVQDAPTPERAKMKDGHIKFDNVHFTYEGKTTVFAGLHLEIARGEKVALVGHSGAGKTTITKLLLRFRDIEQGSITIDGQDITTVTQDDLRRQIAYVPQEPLLFHRSIKENIAYAKPRATMKEIEEVAKKAYAHEFITRLPQGYATLVGERGVKLSGGERQRIAIARAMLKNAPIIMLDEATSALDSLSEQKIQAALWQLVEGKTTIVIAHRLSTIQKMDRIIVFDQGAIVEEGSHQELLQKNGVYAELWNSQVGGFITE